jgi:hypothetical protein
VLIKLHLGFFHIFVEGTNGERALFRLPLRRASEEPGCKGLMVANFTTASIGLVDSIARVGPQRLPSLVVDVLARGSDSSDACLVPLEAAADLISASAILLANANSSASLLDVQLPCSADLAFPPLGVETESALDVAPPAPSPPPEPRRSSRLVAADPSHFISIVDKAILRKKDLNEGPSALVRCHGELSADDLLAVAVEDGQPLQSGDALALAMACDIDSGSPGLEPAASTAGSP